MVNGYSFGASYIVRFRHPIDWFVVAPALMAAHRIVIPYTNTNKDGLTDTLIIQPFAQYDERSDTPHEGIKTQIKQAMNTFFEDDGCFRTLEAKDRYAESLRAIDDDLNAGLVPQYTLSVAQMGAVESCVPYGIAHKGWKTEWIYW